MAAPTNVRVESNSRTTATIRWTANGINGLSLYRALCGGAFAEVTSLIVVTDLVYTDTGLAEGTCYEFKLSDDGGGTFSSTVTVTTQTCMPPAGSLDTFSLPRLSTHGGDPAEEFQNEVNEHFNNLAERVEAVLHGRVLVPGDCVACPNNGALVLNCAGHCKQWLVVADEDINSISLQYCDEGPGNIDIIIPPGATRRIDGWPGGFGFSGDEGFQAPVSGGTNGRTVSTPSSPGGRANNRGSGSRPGTGRGTGPGGGGSGGGGCTCVANGQGDLTIKSCNANNSMQCSSTKSLKLIACGGVPPYTWSETGNNNLSNTSGPTTTVTPPANAGPNVAGTAYTKAVASSGCGHTGGTTHDCGTTWARYGCNDNFDSCNTTDGGNDATAYCFSDASCNCGTHSGHANNGCAGAPTVSCTNTCPVPCDGAKSFGMVQDRRSAGMIADGCNPCGVNAGGATVTVTDSVGTQTTIILRA